MAGRSDSLWVVVSDVDLVGFVALAGCRSWLLVGLAGRRGLGISIAAVEVPLEMAAAAEVSVVDVE